MKLYVIGLFVLINLLVCKIHSRNIQGVFREINMQDQSVTYIEFRVDSTAKLKRVSINDSISKSAIVTRRGKWKLKNDTLILKFDNEGTSDLQSKYEVRLLIKNESTLYSHRYDNGKFVKDNPVGRKATKFVKLPQQLFYEYYNLQD